MALIRIEDNYSRNGDPRRPCFLNSVMLFLVLPKVGRDTSLKLYWLLVTSSVPHMLAILSEGKQTCLLNCLDKDILRHIFIVINKILT